MNETELKRIRDNLYSLWEALWHRSGDEAEVGTQEAGIRLLQGPNETAPIFLGPECANFFKVAGNMLSEIDSWAKTVLVVQRRVDEC